MNTMAQGGLSPHSPISIEANTLEDCTLIQAIVHKDDSALAALYERYANLCYSISYRIVRDHNAAESVLQDTFLKVWEKAERYDGRGSVAGWLVRIARNQALDWLRYERTRSFQTACSWDDTLVERREMSADPRENIEARIDARYVSDRLQGALSQLPTEQRFVVELSFFEELSHHAIADLTGLPLGTIKTRVRLGLQKLQRMLQKEDLSPIFR